MGEIWARIVVAAFAAFVLWNLDAVVDYIVELRPRTFGLEHSRSYVRATLIVVSIGVCMTVVARFLGLTIRT